ncbi:ferritin-like domain-containing protein [Rhodoligotrophos ferricapiens]|uniref:YciE/YciF ferroxidase family protein n=1 Tax=Rhodoligotrophos ferricapiens TaxID=3069264 RepID=UPI00315CC53B
MISAQAASVDEHTDQGIEALTTETKKMASFTEGGALRDAGLIASAQRIEHYEIAVYGTLASYAKALGLKNDAQILNGILEEEKDTDLILSDIAEGNITPTIVEAESR